MRAVTENPHLTPMSGHREALWPALTGSFAGDDGGGFYSA